MNDVDGDGKLRPRNGNDIEDSKNRQIDEAVKRTAKATGAAFTDTVMADHFNPHGFDGVDSDDDTPKSSGLQRQVSFQTPPKRRQSKSPPAGRALKRTALTCRRCGGSGHVAESCLSLAPLYNTSALRVHEDDEDDATTSSSSSSSSYGYQPRINNVVNAEDTVKVPSINTTAPKPPTPKPNSVGTLTQFRDSFQGQRVDPNAPHLILARLQTLQEDMQANRCYWCHQGSHRAYACPVRAAERQALEHQDPSSDAVQAFRAKERTLREGFQSMNVTRGSGPRRFNGRSNPPGRSNSNLVPLPTSSSSSSVPSSSSSQSFTAPGQYSAAQMQAVARILNQP